MCDDIETDRLGKRSALTYSDDITVLDRKCRRAVDGNVLVSLLVTTVLGNVVQVVPSNNDRSLHFGRNDLTSQNSSTDRDIPREGALLVDIVGFNGRIGGLNSKTNLLHPAHGLFTSTTNGTLASYEDTILLLVRFFVL
jgi:hypothetical protein